MIRWEDDETFESYTDRLQDSTVRLRRIALEVLVCGALGLLFLIGCLYAAS